MFFKSSVSLPKAQYNKNNMQNKIEIESFKGVSNSEVAKSLALYKTNIC